MNSFFRLSLVTVLLGCCMLTVNSQVIPVRSGKAAGRIVAGQDEDCRQAAQLFRDFVEKVSGAELPVVDYGAKEKKGDILFLDYKELSAPDFTEPSEDAFRIYEDNGRLYVISGKGHGASYAAVMLAENQLGISYYGVGAMYFDPMSDIVFPAGFIHEEKPAFRYRQTQSYQLALDPLYKIWFRLEEPKEAFAGGYWVHTFNRILPASRFGEEHPEYYSLLTGKRRPGAASQWCLTNPEVFEAACLQLDSIFAANPGLDLISVSQNDGNNTYCQCPDCMEIIEREGAVSGIYVEFLNKLAARYPDKEFSTLAYLFTMKAPKHIKPLPNVNIMLCDIDCNREVPLTDNASGQEFMEALEAWSSISDNIFLWDYGINFDNMVSPFPNFHIIQKNIQIFRDHHVNMHFSQIAGSNGTDFSEMRSYLAAKLMWNPDIDLDTVMRDFMDGYYGPAGRWLYQYEKMLEGGLLASGQRLWIYDSPASHKDGMLNAACRKQYNFLFDKAEAAVAGQPEYLDRVRRSRLPLQYAELEIARAEGRASEPAIPAMLDLFEERTAYFGIPTLNERNNSPAEYCALYRERYLPSRNENLAFGCPVSFETAPTAERYRSLADAGALTDGIYGGSTFVESWVGWEGEDGIMTVDLQEVKRIRYAGCDFLHQIGQWILLPFSIKVSVSEDGVNFTEFGTQPREEDKSSQVKFDRIGVSVAEPVPARYVRFEIENQKICPSWHYGVGQPCWFFTDEIEVF